MIVGKKNNSPMDWEEMNSAISHLCPKHLSYEEIYLSNAGVNIFYSEKLNLLESNG